MISRICQLITMMASCVLTGTGIALSNNIALGAGIMMFMFPTGLAVLFYLDSVIPQEKP